MFARDNSHFEHFLHMPVNVKEKCEVTRWWQDGSWAWAVQMGTVWLYWAGQLRLAEIETRVVLTPISDFTVSHYVHIHDILNIIHKSDFKRSFFIIMFCWGKWCTKEEMTMGKGENFFMEQSLCVEFVETPFTH